VSTSYRTSLFSVSKRKKWMKWLKWFTEQFSALSFNESWAEFHSLLCWVIFWSNSCSGNIHFSLRHSSLLRILFVVSGNHTWYEYIWHMNVKAKNTRRSAKNYTRVEAFQHHIAKNVLHYIFTCSWFYSSMKCQSRSFSLHCFPFTLNITMNIQKYFCPSLDYLKAMEVTLVTHSYSYALK
jgi:hypothetical protein